MSKLLRLLCVCLGVTIVVALQAHSAITAQHRVEHTLQFPGVSYADASAIDHDHDHDHDQAEPAPVSDGPVIDVADTDGDTPVNHHHHSGGDLQLALATPSHPIDGGLLNPANLGPAPDAMPAGLSRDGPSHPPKQLRA
ncbi:MAG: hypothetical protein ACT6R7_10000 [Brevundimonas aurantiaca]|uniref:hypothetical protein n=1 Tax=Brevundimonas aurantiaca TaxID=74316 RepID=UPI0040339D55